MPENDDAFAMTSQIADAPTDISEMKLDLTQDEKIRTVSLMMGIRYHVDTIIKDPRYLEVMIQREKEAKFSNEPDQEHWHLRPSTARGVVGIALEFEAYLRGYHSHFASIEFDGEKIEPVGRAQGEFQDEVQESE
jgi:hypothetical protein